MFSLINDSSTEYVGTAGVGYVKVDVSTLSHFGNEGKFGAGA